MPSHARERETKKKVAYDNHMHIRENKIRTKVACTKRVLLP